jgi:hypothetical protein
MVTAETQFREAHESFAASFMHDYMSFSFHHHRLTH